MPTLTASTAGRPRHESAANFCIAGIGASAGGLEPICEFFDALPADSNIAFVVIQHLYPTHKSLAAEIIGKHASIQAIPAAEGMPLAPNHIYTIPPNTYPSLHDGRLHLDEPKNKSGPRLPIDHFLTSLGDDQRQRAIGIILSGSGTDGCLGLKRIEANGGIVVAQSPETAQFDSMPSSAIATGLVHCVLPVAEMPAALVRYARHEYVLQAGETGAGEPAGGDLEEILNIVHQRRGGNFTGYNSSTLMRRLRRRMALRSIDSLADYVALLKAETPEVDALVKDLLIGVTEFFRDPEAWQEFKCSVVAPLVASKRPEDAIRVWVPGCSTGEEAYSVAILFLEQLRQTGKSCTLYVFATDLNEDAVQLGRLGNYPSGITTQIGAEHLRRYFLEIPDNHHYKVNKTLRDAVMFGHQNLLTDPPFSRMDIICCRNLLTYLDGDMQTKIVSLFRFALVPGGSLFLGSAETPGKHMAAFTPLSEKWRIYRVVDERPPAALQLPIQPSVKPLANHEQPPQPPSRCAQLAPAKASPRGSELARRAQQLLVSRFAPAAVVINASFETLYFSGPTEHYLQIPRGAPTLDILAQARDGLRSRLRQALRQAAATGTSIVVDDARVRRNKGFQPVRFSVVPMAGSGDADALLMVVFEDRASPVAAASPGDENPLVRQLEEELHATKDDLQNTIERLASSNEELKFSHEEVVSINEELQSINEELESSKEELQSLNEELSTVNQQLQMKVAELEASNSDMSNLLSSSQIATICLDRDYRIRWFSPGMMRIGNIIASDIGRPITDFSAVGLGSDLIEDASCVLATLAPKQREFMSQDQHWYLRRTVPYRGDNDHVGGVVTTYTDISEARKSAEAVVAAQRATAVSLEVRVRERTAQLRTLTAELALNEERERRLLARDLHDDLGQVLAIVKIKLNSLEECERRGILKTALKEIEALIDQANRSVRSLMTQLCPPALQTLGLIPALEWLGEEMQRHYGLTVTLDQQGDLPMLREPARTTIFRVVRELLVNVAKHAMANVADINCQRLDDGRVSISVTDHGVGFDHEQAVANSANESGFGLISGRERLEFIGGEMHVDTKPGYGTTVTIIFPATSENH